MRKPCPAPFEPLPKAPTLWVCHPSSASSWVCLIVAIRDIMRGSMA